MAISSEFLDQLKARIQLSTVIGARIKLKRKGRYMSGLCPFHNEKTPSFTVNDAQGSYHCFGCGSHGDVIAFTQLSENMTFIEAVGKLAAFAGMSLPPSFSESKESLQKSLDIYEVLEETASFFQSILRSNQGQEAQKYLDQRGIQSETCECFRLGFSPEENGLKKYLLGRGYSEKQLLAAGLLSQNEEKSVTYDRFRHRLMFPIWDRQGRVIAFGGRILKKGEPKYLNSPETDVFHKGSLLYAYHLARRPAQQAQRLIVCEGYMDVIALHQAGIKYSVAPLGTALTEEQISLLWNLTPSPILCFDGDAPGKKAALRTAERVLPILKSGYSLRYAHLPEGEDPDSLIQRGGLKKLEDTFENSIPLADVLWYQTFNAASLKTPEDRAKFEKTLMKLVQEIKDPILRNNYRDTFKTRLFESFRFYKNAAREKKGANNPVLPVQAKPNFDPVHIQQKILFAGLLNHPQLIEEYYEPFLDLDITSEKLRRLRDQIILKINETPALDSGLLQHHLHNEGFTDLLDDILNEDVYKHASFVRPETDNESIRQGWLEVWDHLQNLKKMADHAKNMDERFQHHLSPLLKAMMRRVLYN
ncbi:DNA primase [Caedimonas varicaedens]|uniref:DNA primase n=1 Tax=Caedimonas varicaedens TaxID=1629334 RepID=A0A0K8ME91_9PROT|nr:DNA primase [Caedimonas varicaedens]